MARRRISAADGRIALQAWAAGGANTSQIRTAVRYTLEELAERAPGNSVEVRVPPAGVIQVIEGPRHTRGTPPNTIEMAPQVWLELVTGRTTWQAALEGGLVHSSGIRADISDHLPLLADPCQRASGGADGITSTS